MIGGTNEGPGSDAAAIAMPAQTIDVAIDNFKHIDLISGRVSAGSLLSEAPRAASALTS